MGVGEIKGKEGERWRREMGVEPHQYIYLIKLAIKYIKYRCFSYKSSLCEHQ